MDISKVAAMGGRARAKSLTPERRREIARMAGAANRGKPKNHKNHKKKNGKKNHTEKN